MNKPTFLGPLIGKGVGRCELVYAEGGSVLASHVEPAFDSKTRKQGLLGRESIPGDYAMIIAPCGAIHTFSMRVPIDVVFVSRDGTVTKTCRGVRPWRMAGSMKAFATIEAAEGFIDRHELVPGEVVALREVAGGDQPVGATLTPSPGRATAPAHQAPRRRVTLADVGAAGVALPWHESVAIAQELCEAVMARGPARDLRVPELKHIALAPDGTVTLLADGPSGHSPVQRTGLVLLALTPEEQLPMQLRLLVLEEVSPRPKLSSLAEFHRELEFFERPDRQSLVRDVFERFQPDSVSAAAHGPVPAPLLEPPPQPRRHDWWRRRTVRMGAGLMLAALAAAVALWAWPRPEGRWVRSNVRQLSKASSEFGATAIAAVRREVEAAGRKLGLTSPEPGRPVAPAASAAPSAASSPRAGVTMEGGAPPPPVQPFELADVTLGAAGTPDAAAPAPRDKSPGLGAVFSASDTGVVPPVFSGLRPLSPNPAGNAVSDQLLYEIVVSPEGLVESVKLVSSTPDVRAGMQLSAIKAWRFEPATLDGQPVRYRMRLRLPVQ